VQGPIGSFYIEEEPKESRKAFQILFNLMPDPVIIVDGKGKFLAVNDRVEEKTGFKREELLGKNFLNTKIVTAKSKTILMKNLAKRMMGMHVAPYEVEVLTKDDKKLTLEINATKIEYDEKLADLVIFRDISERKLAEDELRRYREHLEELVEERTAELRKINEQLKQEIAERKKAEEELKESEEKYRELINGMNDMVWVIDFDGKFIDVNDAAVKILGYSKEELLSMGPCDIDTSLTEEEIGDLIKHMPADEIQVFPTTHTTKDGKTIPVEISSSLVTYHGKQAILSIARNITERKKMEEQLKEYTERLQEKVEERTRELKAAQEQLLRAERLATIGEVATMVGHDMRNPLTGIAGATYYLKTKLNSKMGRKTKDMLKLIEKNIEYSNKIINDLLEYSREIQLKLTEASPKSIIRGALTLVEIPKKIRILNLTENEPKIMVDVQKIQRVFVNMIKNAIDAMPKGGKLTIKSKESDDSVEFAFADTGIGMTKEIMEKLWMPLFTTKAKGIGLGLPICKRIVEAHGGSISVESKVEKGTTFKVTLPIEPKIEEGGEKIWVKLPESLLLTTTKA
jgi:PAS domain S-box-containing protein